MSSALLVVERPVRGDLEPELRRVEVERRVLIADRDAGELDGFDHEKEWLV
jgi:hypothetical protein